MKPFIHTITGTILTLALICGAVACADGENRPAADFTGSINSSSKSFDTISAEVFLDPPLEARPGAYWCWLNGIVDHEQMTREMEEAKALGMRGFEIWDVGVYRPRGFVPAGPSFLGEESLKSIKHAMSEAKRLGLELNMIAASSWNAGGSWVKKSDGSKRIASSSIDEMGPKKFTGRLELPCDKETYYYDVSVLALPQSAEKNLASLDSGINLTGKMDAKGVLTWDIPEGNWTIMRFVCRGTNQRLIVPSPNSDGLLIDHLSAEASERHMLHMINKLGEVDPGHKILKIMSHDSYELDAANDWTEDFPDEFRKRRGYDPGRFLPLLEGWTLDDSSIQARFLADYRKTVGELTVERHFRVSREVLNRHGMQLCAEAGHGGFPRVDPIWALGEADIPRGEFWNGKRFWVTKEAASAAHLYERRFVDSESFTGWRNWLDGPLHYKQLFDVALCAGLNRLTFHTFTHNPPQAGLPGYVYHAGEHFNANNTWWKQSGPMLNYMGRCSYMLQRGDFVADVCFYYGDQAPNLVPSRRIDPNIKPIFGPDKCLHCGRPLTVDFRPLGCGYDFDYIDANSIIKRMTVDAETGQLVVGDMRYRLMVLPDHDHINLDVLRKIRELVKQGAAIAGSVQPLRTNSLTDYPDADRKVARIGAELWGEKAAVEDAGPRSRRFGRGTVYTNMTSRQVLTELDVIPDFTVLQGGSQEGPDRIDYIHRRTKDADIYFVCNGAQEAKSLLCRFREAEGRAEIWYPVSGEICSPKRVIRQPDGSCHIELELPGIGSAFVVFRRDGRSVEKSAPIFAERPAEKIPIQGRWTVKFQPGRLAPESVEWEDLIDWTSSEEPGIKYFSGTATYSIQIDLPGGTSGDYWLDLGRVSEVGEVSLDGHPLGTAWTLPFRVKVPEKLLAEGSHLLEVKVTNVWNNRLVGDQFLPEEERVTRTNMQGQHTKNSPLVTSGLLGPVTLQPVKKAESPGQEPTIPAWFKNGKFGMFIHWGPYSVLGGEWQGRRIKQGDIAEWIMQRFKIPVEEYRAIAATFNPTAFNAREWVTLAKKTGMKYIIITSKHHDGFAMYASGVSDYNIVDYTPFKRDPLRELSEACTGAGIKFCVYYSHREDWEHPYAYGNFWDFDTSQTNLDTMDHPELFRRYLDEKAIPQLKELLTGYGPLGIVWFDRGMYTQDQGREFADLVHNLQPGCLVNGRVGHYDKELLGDYQSMTDNGMPIGGIEEYWETPQTLNETWGYSRSDKNWKTPGEVIRRLVTIVSKGGNYLLNVGPTGRGIIPDPSVRILNAVGDWMKKNSESIYGTSPSPFPHELPWGYCTRKGNRLFLHVFDWPENGQLRLNGLNNRIEKAYSLLNPHEALTVERNESGSPMIGLPAEPPDVINSIFVVEIEGNPDIDPYIVSQINDGTLLLDYLSASTSGKAQKRFNRRGESGHFHISKMQTPADSVEWHVRMNTPGTYHVDITYAARPGWENVRYIVEMGRERIEATVKSTDGWYEYKSERIGQLEVKKAGRTVVKIYPRDPLDHYLMYFNKIELKSVDSGR